MKVCLMSDSHGNMDAMKKVIQKEQPDLVLHAGDCAADVFQLHKKRIVDHTALKIICVAGNCDLPGVADLERIVSLADFQVFLTHGHRYRVKEGYLNLTYKAEEVHANLVVFGHTHAPAAFVERGILYINPGSLSLPRGYRTPTYVVFDYPENTKYHANEAVPTIPLQIAFKSVEHGRLCDDLSLQVIWDMKQCKFKCKKFN